MRLAESANLTYVAALDPIWVNFSISQNQMAQITRSCRTSGQSSPPKGDNFDVEIVLPGGVVYPYRGKIGFTDPSFSQDTGSFLVRAVLPNPKLELRPGMFVTAYVKGAMRPNAIVVPQLAVQQGNNGHLVYVVNANGRRGNPAGGRRRLLRRQGHRDPAGLARAIASSSTAC